MNPTDTISAAIVGYTNRFAILVELYSFASARLVWQLAVLGFKASKRHASNTNEASAGEFKQPLANLLLGKHVDVSAMNYCHSRLCSVRRVNIPSVLQ